MNPDASKGGGGGGGGDGDLLSDRIWSGSESEDSNVNRQGVKSFDAHSFTSASSRVLHQYPIMDGTFSVCFCCR